MEIVNGSVWVDQRRELLVQVLGSVSGEEMMVASCSQVK